MRSELVCTFILGFVAITFANQNIGTDKKLDDSRLFFVSGSNISFTTFTVIKASKTITSTLTTTTSCTTSTAALTTCTVGRRRRGLFYDESAAQGRNRRGLFYNDEDAENKDGTAFLPTDAKSSNNPIDELTSKTVDESSVIPLVVEAGFQLPEGSPFSRFLVAFGTNTITFFTVSTSTVSLTAICSSTTGFPLCGNLGK